MRTTIRNGRIRQLAERVKRLEIGLQEAPWRASVRTELRRLTGELQQEKQRMSERAGQLRLPL